jgi:hydrogenase maturation protein HypF
MLAVGGHLKNTVAFAVPDRRTDSTQVFISQHIGDLETPQALRAFQTVITDMETALDVTVEETVSDAHPDYLSSQHAGRPISMRIQHHFAHIASCVAEHAISLPVLGVAWDGSGYGLDGTIWGGEFLTVNAAGFERAAHFRTFPLPGGDAAARRPEHTAIGLLYELQGNAAFTGVEPAIIRQMLSGNVRCPRTSSVGRLFDAVAALIGVSSRVTFEGQAAMQLEFAIVEGVDDSYDWRVRPGSSLIVDWEPMIAAILGDMRTGAACGVIAARFHNTLADIVTGVAKRVGEPRVVLSGGCFQNRYLSERTIRCLLAAGFEPYWHQRVPPNDGGIAFGQIAARLITKEKSCVSQCQAN